VHKWWVLGALLLAGCANERTVLVKDTGGSKECRAFGWGLIGYPVAKASYNSCLAQAEKEGYHP
jgi:hypothetical protein